MRFTIKTNQNEHNQDNGNAMIYVLIALALFGFLTMTLSRQNNQADGQDIDDEQAEFYANELIEYATSANQVIDRMLYSGTNINELDFINPTSAGFNTPPHIHKVYHPEGGGLNYMSGLSEGIAGDINARWAINDRLTNTEWTPTTQNDVFLTAVRIKKEICESINKKITGSKDIPISTNTLGELFTGGTHNLDSTNCPNCAGYSSLCLRYTSGANNSYGFYNIIVAQ